MLSTLSSRGNYAGRRRKLLVPSTALSQFELECHSLTGRASTHIGWGAFHFARVRPFGPIYYLIFVALFFFSFAGKFARP